MMKDSIKLADGHFQLPLLWRSKDTRLPPNRCLAERRSKCLRKRFSKDKELHLKYTEVMQGYIEKWYAERLVSYLVTVSDREWFLPQFPIFKPNKPEKLRIVFDCAAKHMGTSLNDVLMQGTDLVNNLIGVLTHFRMERITLVVDIEAIFHQVKVTPKDRDSLRFFW